MVGYYCFFLKAIAFLFIIWYNVGTKDLVQRRYTMKKYESPELLLILAETYDVITASGNSGSTPADDDEKNWTPFY